jgi:TonB family protein
MIAAWMLYATLVALLLGAAAWTLEGALQAHRLALRWIWTAALLGSCAIPSFALLRPAPSVEYAPVVVEQGTTFTAPPGIPMAPAPEPSQLSRIVAATLDRLSAPPTLPSRFDPLASGVWAILTLGVVGALGASFAKLRRSRRKWVSEQLDGRDVLISEEVGPAVVGVLKPAIVVPRWALSLPSQDRELVLRHEEEHRRAGDLRLLFASLIVLALVPWNAALWWQVRRLRMAVELDCDHRVLRKARELRRYASLLVEMGRRGSISRLSALALAHPAPFLERRIQKMTSRTKPRWWATASLAVVASLFTMAGSRVQAPPLPQPEYQVELSSPPTPAEPTAQVAGKRLIPPNIEGGRIGSQGVDEIAAATAQEIPRLEEIVVTGTAGAARRRAAEAAGTPPTPGSSTTRRPEPTPQPAVAAVLQPGRQLRDAPVALPHTVGPELINRDEVSRALVRAYPPVLRDASVSGTVGVWLFIDENGIVDNVMLQASSDYTELNEAALDVARVMRFNAASNRGDRVPLWVSIPITFRVAGAARLDVGASGAGVGWEPPGATLGRITGRITDAASGEPLADVEVSLVGQNLGTMSRQNGVFVILNVPPGTYEMRVERVGLAPLTRSVTVASAPLTEFFEMTPGRPGPDRQTSRIIEVPDRETRREPTTQSRSDVQSAIAAALGRSVSAEASGPGGASRSSGMERTSQPVGRVTGRVTDQATGAPLGQVQVYVVGLSLGSLSRETGAYVILNIPPGTYELRAERVGLTLGRREITVVEGEAVEANFELAPQAIGMDEILSDRVPGAVTPGSSYATQRAAPQASPPPAQAAQVPENAPRFTPHTVKPKLLNGPEVQALMISEYPVALREAGVGGTAVIWLFIDVNGVVENARVQTGSGYPAIDEAAVRVARAMRWEPALNRDQKVAVWVAIPITFRQG